MPKRRKGVADKTAAPGGEAMMATASHHTIIPTADFLYVWHHVLITFKKGKPHVVETTLIEALKHAGAPI